MYKELILVKDINNYWISVHCYELTKNMQITNIDQAIVLVRDKFQELQHGEVLIEGNDVFILTPERIDTIKGSSRCD